DESAEFYRQACDLDPFDAKINYHWGQALLALDRLPEAADCFRRILSIDPNHPGGCQALSHVLRRQGESAEAMRYARRAARLTRNENPDILLSLADAYADAGRLAEATEAATQALNAVQPGNLQLVPQIRKRLREFQERGAAIRK